MKKIICGVTTLVLLFLFTSCLSLGINPFAMNTKIQIPFSGTMDTCYGYENLKWGMSFKQVKDAGYPLTNSEKKGTFVVALGKTERYYDEYSRKYRDRNYEYGHGEVNETLFSFENNRLCSVYDTFLTTPSMDELHKRYGDFSEQNKVTTDMQEDGIVGYYYNLGHASIPGFFTFEIFIYKNGKTIVNIHDFPSWLSSDSPTVEILDKNYSIANEKDKVQSNKWNIYASFNPEDKMVAYTFVNQNKDGKYLFVGYAKSVENPVLSYVRSGLCWRNNTSGTYEIKIGTNVNERNFSTAQWSSLYNGEEYTYTYNSGESAREMLNLFLQNEKFTVRHNGTVSEFICNPEDLIKLMSSRGVSIDELDAAMTNEEF